MTDKPGRTPASEAARAARLAREAAALRANLHRRKAQARAVADNRQTGGRDEAGRPVVPPADED